MEDYNDVKTELREMLILEDQFHSWDRSTKSQSKQRRDLINSEISVLRDLLPFPPAVRTRLSQLQLMACVCVYLRKTNYFSQAFPSLHFPISRHVPLPTDFSKAMVFALLTCNQDGKFLFIGENAAEILGQTLEDLFAHGDNLYDIIDQDDHCAVRRELALDAENEANERIFVCRINSAKNIRKQGRFVEQKTVASLSKLIMVSGKFLPQPHQRTLATNERIFLGICTPLLMPNNRESVVSGYAPTFTTLHQRDMKLVGIDHQARTLLGYNYREILGHSWYEFLHWDDTPSARETHKFVVSSEDGQSVVALVRFLHQSGHWICCHVVLQPKDDKTMYTQCEAGTWTQPLMTPSHQSEEAELEFGLPDSTTSPTPSAPNLILCTYQIVSQKEFQLLRKTPWLYDLKDLELDDTSTFAASTKYSKSASTDTTRTSQHNLPSSSCTILSGKRKKKHGLTESGQILPTCKRKAKEKVAIVTTPISPVEKCAPDTQQTLQKTEWIQGPSFFSDPTESAQEAHDIFRLYQTDTDQWCMNATEINGADSSVNTDDQNNHLLPFGQMHASGLSNVSSPEQYISLSDSLLSYSPGSRSSLITSEDGTVITIPDGSTWLSVSYSSPNPALETPPQIKANSDHSSFSHIDPMSVWNNQAVVPDQRLWPWASFHFPDGDLCRPNLFFKRDEGLGAGSLQTYFSA